MTQQTGTTPAQRRPYSWRDPNRPVAVLGPVLEGFIFGRKTPVQEEVISPDRERFERCFTES
jgi:hypothetical protein